ncbi:MAG TPA: ATPase domain-containing protein [Vicinamibacterales bacterium]|jgi:circadian clock protein KaiC|nr:ATPase domain-containing protein [Vicinamibacterales bacterium]
MSFGELNSASIISTGVSGLDELLRGGLTPNRLYLIEGSPGTGKTTLAMQFLLEGRDRGEKTLYVTLSETKNELTAIARSHGWSLDNVELFQLSPAEGMKPEDQYTLYHPAEVELGETVKSVLEIIDRVDPTRVVFDSLSELKLLARDPLRYRRQILALKEYFSGRECTVVMLDDLSAGGSDLQLQSLAHGVILLEMLPFEYGRARRRLRIVKFRGVSIVEGFHDFVIRQGGLDVFPQLVAANESMARAGVVASGMAELDQLLGGGLTWGTTTLMIGPAGSGKSTLAAHYAASGVTQTNGAIFLFDERARTFIARCDALGMKLSERLASGHVKLTQIEPGDMSPGEFSHRVRLAVERDNARVILIDSLNGYLNAIPQVEGPLVRMHELLSFLNERGIVTLMVVAQHGIVGSNMATPIDVSYLADTVVLLRFFESAGVVRRAVSVMKKRSGPHEQTIREFQLGPDRLHVGAALSDFQGVLTGVPHYIGAAAPLFK